MRTLLVATLLATLALSAAAEGEQVDNPTYLQWSKFKVGAWVRRKVTAEEAGQSRITKVTVKLVESTAEKVVLEYVNVQVLNGNDFPQAAVRVTEPAKVGKVEPKAPDAADAPKSTRKEGEEEVEAGGGKVACRTLEITIDSPALKSWSKSWSSDAVPGGLVRSEVKIESPTVLTSTTVVEEFKTE